jgi:hypothetical protein
MMLDIWPALPIIIWNGFYRDWPVEGADNIIAALECKERVYQINLGDFPSWLWESFTAAMQGPVSSLTSLLLWSNDESAPVLPDSFLSKSAPRL